MESIIREFVTGIEKGPFKCLRDYEGNTASAYIPEQNKDLGDIYDCAVYQAWLDMCRKLPDAGKGKKEQCKEARNIIADALRKYFQEDAKEKCAFDEWHFRISTHNNIKEVLNVGMAQKIINMAMKYLFCCEDILQDHKDHFVYCHIPLDSLILDWLNGECAKEYKAIYKDIKWSQIVEYDDYKCTQEEVRRILGERDILRQEFSIWQDENTLEFVKSIVKIRDDKLCPCNLSCELNDFVKGLTSHISKESIRHKAERAINRKSKH